MTDLKPKWRRNLTLGASCILGCEALRRGVLLEDPNLGIPLGWLSAASLLTPTLIKNCQWFGPVLSQFPAQGRQVWLTIDDGPDPQDTPEILDVLARHEAHATFFCIGKKILRWPLLTEQVSKAGHSVQCHTFNHPAGSFWAALPRRARREIQLGVEAVRSATEISPTQIRMPAGLGNLFVHAAAEEAGLQMIGWSASGLDGIAHIPEKVIARIFSALKPGCIILLHEGPLFGLRPGTRARTLEKVLRGLKERGYETVKPILFHP
jgi:peptidoglycan/xylan/chitin deacetylase (PgdA/CDA1 family)